ncbi:MAG: hypothetical protein JW768_00120 [Chitinispirillaceae bacterium]|nr:hypothetical protein [Chitinispirillaceae bacterium]
MKLTKEEIGRKLLHLMALLMPVGIFYAPSWSFPAYFMTVLLGSLFIASVAIELLRFKYPLLQGWFYRCFGTMLRKEEDFKITGSTWVIGAAFFCTLLFPAYPHVSFMVLVMFILGDAIAALVGISMGRIRIGKKSLEGSLACFSVCVILFFLLFPHVPGLLEPWGNSVPVVIVLSVSFVIMLFELLPLRIHPRITINDNLAVPIIAGYAMIGLEKMIL